MSRKRSFQAELKEDSDDEESDYEVSDSYGIRNFSKLYLKPDHELRPIWLCPNAHIFLETYSRLYKLAYDFLIAIAEPVARPKRIHEYRITDNSLYAAASLGLTTEHIIDVLGKLSKVEVSETVKDYIRKFTGRVGKIRMVLKQGLYFIESEDASLLDEILLEPVIRDARIDHLTKIVTAPVIVPAGGGSALLDHRRQQQNKAPEPVALDLVHDKETGFVVMRLPDDEPDLVLGGASDGKKVDQDAAMGLISAELDQFGQDLPMKRANGTIRKMLAFQLDREQVEAVKARCKEIGYPMLEEYDFRRDRSSPDLPVQLKPIAKIRDYQEKSLSKMFGNGRARSGIIVLPCGAGKTLVGITAMCTVRKSTLIFCTTSVAVNQWKNQIRLWTSLEEDRIACFTSGDKDEFPPDPLVVITTYSMIGYTGQRSKRTAHCMARLYSNIWGLILLDEVHVAPADMFKRCVSQTHSRCKLGLTATLVREDDRIKDLSYLVGPKLYEANWIDLQTQGYIATVQCVEVWCDMSAEFYAEYLRASQDKKRLLYVMNPNKYRAAQFLIRQHEARGDKSLVFSDNVWALKHYAQSMGYAYICGETSRDERIMHLQNFQTSATCNTLCISKVGDNSIDLPDVNVIIQISSHFAARRQEAQRLGRILRPKRAELGRVNAFFYTLVSRDTREMEYATKRQRFLVDQGYAFKVVTNLATIDDSKLDKPLAYHTRRSQAELLAKCLSLDDKEGRTEQVKDDVFDPEATGGSNGGGEAVKRTASKAVRKKVKAGDLSRGRVTR
eukprot:gb/GEZN01002515.1/.p1 GENE.gb/GEZN01002515.1/~~gb/GEZN01002515.1/.p1  ORF type:complete len:816 (-),score=68.18 gb/GEZN01002515.1/:8-2359(-)